MVQVAEINPVFKYIVWVIPSSVLLIVPSFSDPINLPKLLILLPLTLMSLVSYLALLKYSVSRPLFKEQRVIILLYALLGLGITISGFLGSNNSVRILLGAEGRNNGLIYYLCAILLSIILLTLTIGNIEFTYLNIVIQWTSVLFAFYCFIQLLDLDFVSWNNPYSKIIGTLGNPNFSSSALAIFSVYWMYYFVFREKRLNWSGLSSLSMSILMLFLSWSTQSLQGLIVFASGMGLIIFIYLREKSSSSLFPFLWLIGGGVSLLLVFSAFLGLGPFGSSLEQYTLKLRGWYAYFGVRAMIESPWTGVGADNYVSAFRRFRTEEFVSQYGSALSANNAHSTPIQLGASFGLVVFVLYCFLQFLILYKGLRILSYREVQIPSLKVLAIVWILIFSQSLLSIEIIGLGILNWILGAFLLSVNLGRKTNSEEIEKKSRKNRNLFSFPAWTGALGIASGALGAIVFAPFSIEDRAYLNLSMIQVNSPESKEFASKNFDQLSALTLSYPEKVDKILGNMIQAGLNSEAESVARNLYGLDDSDVYSINLLANLYRSSGDSLAEIKLRERARELDPWNERLEFSLAQLYAETSDAAKLKESVERIKAINPESMEYQEASLLLTNLTANP
jgi:hypothetical protein